MGMTNLKKHGIGLVPLVLFWLAAAAPAAALTVTPNTWNVIGLDSNTPAFGPNRFPVGAKVCGGTPGATETASFSWDSATGPDYDNLGTYIYLRAGSANPITITFGADGCADAYFEVEVDKNSGNAPFDKKRRYHITAGGVTTPTPRELYVEHLVSQSRNGIDDVKLNGVSVPAGGSLNLVVGNTYTIELDGHTAPGGYNQFEEFINFPNTIFQVLSVSTDYSTNNSPYVSTTGHKYLYADACQWENDPNSPFYRSCFYDYKSGSTVSTTYTVKIISGGGTSQTLGSLLYDFSGSSFHYNADFSTGARIANIIDPTTVTISKNFSPNPTNMGGVSTLTFTLTNPNAGAVSGLNFTDIFPSSPGAMTLYDTTVTNTCGGALTDNSGNPVAAGSLGIKLSGGTVAANSNCVVQVNVTPAETGTYTNTSQNLFVNSVDTGKSATATLTVNTAIPAPQPPPSCTNPVTIAQWNFDNLANGTATTTPAPSSSIVTATANYTGTGTSTITNTYSSSAPNAWSSTGYTTSNTATDATQAYIDFDLDTTQYGGVGISFAAYAPSGTWGGQNHLYLYSSANGGAFSNLLTAASIPTSWTTYTYNATATGSNNTTFRINAAGSKATPSTLYLDTVSVTGCPTPNPPTITKAFATSPVSVGGTSNLTFTITNPNSCCALSGIGFSDTLPLNALQGAVDVTNGSSTVTGTGTAFTAQLTPGSIVYINKIPYTVSTILSNTQLTLTAGYAGATASGLTATAGLTLAGAVASPQCGGAVTTSTDATTGAPVITLSGGTLTAGAGTSCTVTATVKDSIGGTIANVANAVTATESGQNNGPTGIATASLTAVLPPAISKQFAQNPILSGGTSTLTFLISNPNQNDSLSGVAFSDTFPATMVVTTPATYTTTDCGAPTFAPVAGAGSISFTNGTIAPGGTCKVKVDVTATAAGTNTSGNVSHIINAATVNGNTATDTLTITPPHPAIYLLKQVASNPAGPWYDYLVVSGGNVYYRFTVENAGDVDLATVSVSDPTLTGLGVSLAACSWGALAKYDVVTCDVGPVVAASGSHQNIASVSGDYGGTTYPDTDYAFYATPALSLTKSAAPTFFTAAGNVLNYSYDVTNSGAAILDGPVTVADDKTTVTCPAVSSAVLASDGSPGDGDEFLDPGEKITCTATYTVTAADVTAGQVTNTATASTPAGEGTPQVDSNTATKTIPLVVPSLLVVKSVQAFSDPINGTTSPKPIPGAVMLYTLVVTNTGLGAVDDNTTVITDPIPANTELFVDDINGAGSGPVLFTDGAVPSGLSYSFSGLGSGADSLFFSDNGGATYDKSDTAADANLCDPTVTHLRISLGGIFNASDGTNHPSFSVKFKVRVK